MQIIRKALNRNTVTLRPETINDLYILSLIIVPSDLVYSITTRRVRRPGVQSRSGEEGERKTLSLWLRVLSVEFSEAQGEGMLYLKGTIEAGPDDYIAIGDSHSIGVKTDQNIKIKKDAWNKFHLEKLNDAVKATKKSIIGLIAIERGYATLAVLDNYDINIINQINQNIPSKLSGSKNRNKAKTEFFDKIIMIIRTKFKNISKIFVGGPGTIPKEFVEYMNKKSITPTDNIQVESASSGKKTGIYELSEKETIKTAVKNHQTAKINELLTEFELRLLKDPELITYGKENVKYADMCGAIDQLLITDKLLRQTSTDSKEIRELVSSAENKGSNVIIVNSNGKTGEIVEKFGGIIALLRYRLPEEN